MTLVLCTLLGLLAPTAGAAASSNSGKRSPGAGSSTTPQALYVVTSGNEGNREVLLIDPETDKKTGSFFTDTNFASEMVVAPGARVAFVSTGRELTRVDLGTHQVHHFFVRDNNDSLTGLAIAPDGKTLYVLCREGVCPINAITDKMEPTILINGFPVTNAGFHHLTMSPDGKVLYALLRDSLVPITVANHEAGPAIPLGANATSLAMTSDGKTAYVISTDSTVVPVDLVSGQVGTPIRVPGLGEGIAVAPDGKTVFVSSSSLHNVTPINVSTMTMGAPTLLGGTPGDVVVSPNGTKLYVANTRQRQLNVVSLPSRTVQAPVIMTDVPGQLLIAPVPSAKHT